MGEQVGSGVRAGGIARRRAERGAAAVEFALVAPVIALLVFGIVSYGYMLSFRQALSQGAAEGARAAAVSPFPSQSDKQQAGLDALNEALGSYGVTCEGVAAGSALRKNGERVGSCSLVTATCALDVTEDCVIVALDYEYGENPLVPTMPGVGLVLPDHLTYDATARVS